MCLVPSHIPCAFVTFGNKVVLQWITYHFFFFFLLPDQLLLMDCANNYRMDHCRDRNAFPKTICETAEQNGVGVLHGNAGAFSVFPVFRAIYSAFETVRTSVSLSTITRRLCVFEYEC